MVLIASLIAQSPHSGLVRVLWQALISGSRLLDEEVRELAGSDASSAIVATARQVADAAHRIVTDSNPIPFGRRKGAVLERLVHDLVSWRAVSIEREVEVELLASARCGRPWSNPKELVVPTDPFEAFECKFSPSGLNQDDFNELTDIDEAAEADGKRGWSTLVVMASDKALAQARVRHSLARPLHFAHLGDLVKLRKGPAQRQLV